MLGFCEEPNPSLAQRAGAARGGGGGGRKCLYSSSRFLPEMWGLGNVLPAQLAAVSPAALGIGLYPGSARAVPCARASRGGTITEKYTAVVNSLENTISCNFFPAVPVWNETVVLEVNVICF